MAELENEEAQQRSGAARIGETLRVAQEQVEKIRGELVAVEAEIGSIDAAQAELRGESEKAHEVLGAHEVKLAEDRQRAQFMADEVKREFAADVATLDWKALLWHAGDEPAGLQTLDLE